MLVLGTAGTGKTFTLKCAIDGVRRFLGGFNTVALCAHTGVAAANLGGGASTLDSLFRLAGANADRDLDGEKLGALAQALESTKLIVIDEVSTLGAAQLEMVSRRMEQVSEWRYVRQFRRAPGQGFGGFGGASVVLSGDFAQLPPVRATSLLSQSPLQETQASGLRGRAQLGQQRFKSFSVVIRLRRIYRQRAVDAYKDSITRLRDAACPVADLICGRPMS